MQHIGSHLTDPTSPLVSQLLMLNAPEPYTRLTVRGPGNPSAKQKLRGLSEKDLLAGPVRSHDDARAMLSGLWLWHDWLDESHTLAQSIRTPTGSLWHAIIHRREGDFANSRYWLARCEGHPLFPTMLQQARPLVDPRPADMMLLKLAGARWDPVIFVDLVEMVHQRPDDPRHALAVSLQQLEWRLLFDHCTRAAG
jgi:hypothetical protein